MVPDAVVTGTAGIRQLPAQPATATKSAQRHAFEVLGRSQSQRGRLPARAAQAVMRNRPCPTWEARTVHQAAKPASFRARHRQDPRYLAGRSRSALNSRIGCSAVSTEPNRSGTNSPFITPSPAAVSTDRQKETSRLLKSQSGRNVTLLLVVQGLFWLHWRTLRFVRGQVRVAQVRGDRPTSADAHRALDSTGTTGTGAASTTLVA